MTTDELVERVAEAIHVVEFGRWAEHAHPDHNHWTWRGDGTGDEAKKIYRQYARAAINAMRSAS